MSLAGWLFFIVLFLGLLAVVAWAVKDWHGFEKKKMKIKNEEWLCKTCGYSGLRKNKRPGNVVIEIILWLFYIIPGLIYTIWRISAQYYVCPKCEGKEMIPLDSVFAKNILERQ
ncbi:MAG: hypothetical protein LW823_00825 [Rickettsiales bacterium]|jgi:predicted nucleic-acid-binding Zn-ribbon protein|nr:hypothetical protein [Rickettsiales bacterium]